MGVQNSIASYLGSQSGASGVNPITGLPNSGIASVAPAGSGAAPGVSKSSMTDPLSQFLIGNGNTQTTNSSSTSTRDPYAPAVPYVNQNLASVSSLYNGGAPQISPLEQSGYDAVSNVANNPTAAYTDAGTQLDKTINGDYLTPDSNPYLAAIGNTVGSQAAQIENNQFGGSTGRSNSGLAGYYSGQGVGTALTNLYGSEYNSERANQMSAINEAPTYQQSQYLAPQAEISAGQNVSARPFDIANQYSSILDNIANLGGTTTSTGTSQTQGASNGGLLGSIVSNVAGALFPS